MKQMTKEEATRTRTGIIGMAVFFSGTTVITFLVGGWGWGLGVGGVAALVWGASVVTNLPELRRYSQLEQKTRIAELEAAAGLAVIHYEGKCSNCGKPLVVGALHCTRCGVATERKPKVCQFCAAPNPADAEYCADCGKAIP